jgi:hypothetical protein
MTNEHVLPKWLRDVLPGEGKMTMTYAPPGANEPTLTWKSVDPGFKVKDVCATCNNGWMSALEGRAKPFLTPMIQGRGRTFYDGGRRLISSWAFKTMLMFQLMEPPEDRFVPASAYDDYYAHRQPLPGTRLWIGANSFGEGAWQRGTRFKAVLPDAEADYIYGATLSIGHLVFQVFGTEPKDGESRKITGKLANALIEVWPVSNPVTWPPPALLDRNGVGLLSDMFARSFTRPG